MSTARSTYADLRVSGQVVLPSTDEPILSSLRRLAKADGLAVKAYRAPHYAGVSAEQHRTRPYTVALVSPADPTTIVRPDWQRS